MADGAVQQAGTVVTLSPAKPVRKHQRDDG